MSRRELLLRIAEDFIIFGHALAWLIGFAVVALCAIYEPWYVSYAVAWLAIHLALSKEGCPFIILGKIIKQKLKEA